MKVLHIIPTFYPATYFGGPVHSVYGLCNALSENKDIELRVITTDNAGPENSRIKSGSFPVKFPNDYNVYYFKRIFGVSVSMSLLLNMPAMIRWADVVHLTGVYSFPTVTALFFCRLFKKPLVWSPRGSLQRWEGTSKKVFKKIWEYICNVALDKNKTVFHVTSQLEAEESKKRIKGICAEIIKNGVDIPLKNEKRKWLSDGKLRLLFIGRLHPKKGIENLLNALRNFSEGYTLTICGSGDNSYVESLKKMAKDFGISNKVNFAGHVEGDLKSKMFWSSDVCVVPSHTENFGMVVAEALAYGVPVIASKGTPWQEIVEHDCGLWIENDPKSLANAIAEMRHKDLPKMGLNGRKWIEKEFSWQNAAEKMEMLYQKMVKINQ